MANFKTHIQFATIGSGMLSTVLVDAGILQLQEALMCWAAGTVGGILPDIDSDNSHSINIIFGLLSGVLCFGIIVFKLGQWPVVALWCVALGCFTLLNTVVKFIFKQYTVHRGVFHSLLGGVLFSAMLVCGASFFGVEAKLSWSLGAFVAFGFVLHLILDEIYSIDFMGVRVKRSFGSAFKLFDYRNWHSACGMLVIVLTLFYFSPSPKVLIDAVTNSSLSDLVAQK